MPGTRFKVTPNQLTPASQLELSLDQGERCVYHDQNPHIYVAFEKMTLETIAKGFKNYGASGIFELIRWHTGVTANDPCFKLRNDYKPFYARLFAKKHPEHKDFFRTRKSKFDTND